MVRSKRRPGSGEVAAREIKHVFSSSTLSHVLTIALLCASPVYAVEQTQGEEDSLSTGESIAQEPLNTVEDAFAEPALIDSRDVKYYRDAIANIEASDGAYAQGLHEQLLSLGLSLQQQGRHEEAIKTLKRGVHLARVNSGLYSIDQIPLLQTEIASHMAMGDYLQADERQGYLYRVQQRGLREGDQRAQALMQQARWQRRAYDMGVGELDFPRLLNMWDLYRLALNDVIQEEGEHSLALLIPLNGMLEAQYLISAYQGEQSSTFGENLSDRYDKSRFNAYRSQSFKKGQAVIHAIDDIEQKNNEEDRVVRARGMTRLGDWLFFHGEKESAIEIYREAFMELAESENAQVELAREFGAPVPLPSMEEVKPFPETTSLEMANLLLEFGVSDRGRVVDLRRIDEIDSEAEDADEPPVANDAVANRFMRKLRRTRFRPRFENGEPVATEGISWAYDTTKW